MSILIGLLVGLLILGGVAFLALRAGDKPMRRRDSQHDYVAPFWTGDGGSGGGSSGA